MAAMRARHTDRQTDTALVIAAAQTLDITEFELFELAHRAWHGAPAPAAALEGLFGRYMMTGRAPAFVRHLARRAAALESAVERARLVETLWPQRPCAPAPPGPHAPLHVTAVAAAAAILMLGLLTMGGEGTRSGPLACQAGPGMQALAGAAAQGFGTPWRCPRPSVAASTNV